MVEHPELREITRTDDNGEIQLEARGVVSKWKKKIKKWLKESGDKACDAADGKKVDLKKEPGVVWKVIKGWVKKTAKPYCDSYKAAQAAANAASG